jgi:PAS domain S-box-containing protein
MTVLGASAWFRSGRDSSAVRVVSVLRVAALLSVAGIGSFAAHSHGRVAHLLLVIGLVGVPWSTIVFFCADRPDNRIALYGGPLGDLLVLFAVQAILDGAVEPVLPGYLVLVAFTVYTVGRSFAAMIVTGAIALTLVAHQIGPGEQRLHTSITLPLFVGVIAVLFLVERTTVLQEKATAASERLQGRADKILEHVADAVFVTDGAGRMLVCNPAAERLVGRPGQALAGAPCHEVVGLRSGERALDCSSGCALLRMPATDGHELWREDSSGRRQPLLAEAAEVPASNDGGSEVVHSMRDITRLKQAEEAKTLFLATASHELKTPLTVISGFASTLLRYPDIDDKMRGSALDAIHTRSIELTRIVERLLLSSRIEAGRLDLDLSVVNVTPLLRERVKSSAAGISRTVTFNAAAEVPDVIGNPQALTTVVDHLLDNAVKYSPNGEPVVVDVSTGDHAVCISVGDQGIGMDAEQAQHCFDRFWQAESTDVRRFGGTGIGLYIVHSLVDAMGGSITVDSEPGQGSTFVIQLRREGAVPEQQPTSRKGEATSIREFMRQIGVPERTNR